jgi:hypothetical protein
MSGPASTPEALAHALRQRLALIADRDWVLRDAAGHLEALKNISETISSLSARLPEPVHPQLRHYLERCSYDKALAFLSGSPGAADSSQGHTP